MSELECVEAFLYGMNALPPQTDVLCVGEMGIANTTSASALCRALYGNDGTYWAGPGTGLDSGGISRKAAVIDEAFAHHGAALSGDPLRILRYFGGRELAALCGAVLAARLKRIPVLLDGFATTAACAPLHALRADALDHCRVAHVSAEPGHRKLLALLGFEPLLDLSLRLGEGTGAVLAAGLVRVAVACHCGMATFAEAGISIKEK